MNENKEKQIIANGQNYQEDLLSTDNTRLASIFLMFGAALHRNCPLEWVDMHRSRESFIRNLEDPSNPEYQPKPKVTFNFYSGSVNGPQVVEAFDAEYSKLEAEFEVLIASMPEPEKKALRAAVSQMITRACHETLLKREELVRLIKRVPNNSKFDQVSSGQRIVRIGKCSSPELRARYLSKLPA
jgi:hypothetical protein